MTGAFHWFPPLVVIIGGLAMLAVGYLNLHGGGRPRRPVP